MDEYCIIINVLRFMDTMPKSFLSGIAVSRRDQLSIITGVSHKIAQQAIDYFNSENGLQDHPPPTEAVEGSKRGRKRKPLEELQRERLKGIVQNLNKSGASCTSTIIKNRLEADHQIKTNKSTLVRQLKTSGLKYSKGNRPNKDHESPVNVNYRRRYVQERLTNLDENGKPIRPEVFLDESYIH